MKTMIGQYSMVLAGLLMLSGCGGSSSNGGEESAANLPNVDAVVAEATTEHATEAMETIMDGSDGSGILSYTVLDVDFEDSTPEVALAQRVAAYAQTSAQTENISASCEFGGTVSGSFTATSEVTTGVLTFNNCQEYDGTFDGSIGVSATVAGETLQSMAMSFPRDFTVTNSDDDMSIRGGSIYSIAFNSLDTMAYTSGTVLSSFWFSTEDLERRYDNLTMDFTETEYTGTYCYRSGRIYIADLTRYLDVDENYGCQDPFTWQENALVSGSARFIGANNGVVEIEVVGDDNISITAGGVTTYIEATQ